MLAGLRWTLRSWSNLNSLVVSVPSASLEGYNAAYLTHILLLQTLAFQLHVLLTQLHKKRQRTHYLSFSTLKLKNTQEHPAKNQRKGLPVKSFIETFTLLSSNRKRTDPYFTDVNEDEGTSHSRIRQFHSSTNLCQEVFFSRSKSCRYSSLTDQKSTLRVVLNKLLFTSSSHKILCLLTTLATNQDIK